uniref:Uncharacterized protein n=1 Tax=Clastoptera arizonana TaxID=38151 RepID=A0A1B6E2T1_9HEMI
MTKLGVSNDGKIEYFTLTKDDAQEALEVIRAGFFPHENICVACEVALNPAASKELEQLLLDIAQDEVSVFGREKNTKNIVGVCFNKIQVNISVQRMERI